MVVNFFSKRTAILWTILAMCYLWMIINPFKEARKLYNLIDDISCFVAFGGLALYSWKQYYKKKKEIKVDKSDTIKDEKNV